VLCHFFLFFFTTSHPFLTIYTNIKYYTKVINHNQSIEQKDLEKRETALLNCAKFGLYVSIYGVVALLVLATIALVSSIYGWSLAYVILAIPFGLASFLFGRFTVNIKKWISPEWYALQSFSPEHEHAKSMLNDLCVRLGVKPPSLMVVSKLIKPVIFFYSSGGESGTIVMYEGVPKALTHEELEAAFTHEIHHVKKATPALLWQNVLRNRRTALGLVGFFLYNMCIPIVVSPPFTISGHTVGIAVLSAMCPLWLAVTAETMLIPSVAGAIWVFIKLGRAIGITETTFLIQHELYADWFAAITLGRPLTLSRALSAISTLGAIGSVQIAQHAQPINVSPKEMKALPNILKVKMFRTETLAERQVILFVIDKLLNSHVAVEIERKPWSFAAAALPKISSEIFSALEIPTRSTMTLTKKGEIEFSNKVNQLGKKNLKRIFNFIEDHRSGFNIKDCANNLGLDQELVLYGIFALIMTRVIEPKLLGTTH